MDRKVGLLFANGGRIEEIGSSDSNEIEHVAKSIRGNLIRFENLILNGRKNCQD